MEYISTRNKEKIFSFKDVFLKSLANDGGLFVPKKIPSYTLNELKNLSKLSYNELTAKVVLNFCSDQFSEKEIKELVDDSYKNFRVKNVIEIKQIEQLNLALLLRMLHKKNGSYYHGFLLMVLSYLLNLKTLYKK